MSDFREPIVSTSFKQVSDGWVFRAPSPWAVGPSRHYLVNEAQKARIMAILMPSRPMLRAAALVVPLTLWLLVFTQVIVPFGFDLAHLSGRDIFLMSGLFVVPLFAVLLIFHWWNLRLLRPVLAGLPRTTEKIPNRDMYPALARALPAWNLALIGFGLSLMCLGNASTLASRYGRYHHVGDTLSLVSLTLMVLTGVPAAYFFYRAIRNAIQNRHPSGAGPRMLPTARVSIRRRIAMALAIVLGFGMLGFGVAEIFKEYDRGQRVSRLAVRIDALAKEVANAKSSRDPIYLEGLRTRIEAIQKENEALRRAPSKK